MTENLDQAKLAVASEIGPDIAEFTPSGDKNFLVPAAVALLGGVFLTAFFKGIAETAGKKVGEALVDFVGGVIHDIRGKNASEQNHELENSSKAAAAARAELSPEQLAAISAAVESALAKALAKGADEDVASRVAARVRAEGLKVIREERAA